MVTLETLFVLAAASPAPPKGGAALVRAKSGVATAGLANLADSTVETVGAAGPSLFAVAMPLHALVAVVLLLVWVVRRLRRLFAWRIAND